jgi:signal transduction histidine kinase
MKPFDALPLRARLFLLIGALVLGVLIISVVGFYVIEDHLEGLEVRMFLEQEAERIVLRLDEGTTPDAAASGVKYFHKEVPAELRPLSPGDYAEVAIGGRMHDVLVEQYRSAPLYVALPVNEIEQLEVSVFVFFSFWVVLLTTIAMFLAYRLSARLVGPVGDLARRVGSLSPMDRGIRLEADFRGEEVERIAHAIDQYLERLEGFVERERSFTSATSHELRTPLAVISGAAEILAETVSPQSPASDVQRKAVERIQRATAEMSQFIDALLALARDSESGAYRAETDVAAVVKRVCEEAREQTAVGVVLECRCAGALPVAAPPALVHIVISNLVRNALRHTIAGRVVVDCNSNELAVSDEGEGMAPGVLDHVFERHFSGSGGGAGIGLYLVKRICDQYGWEIVVQSQPGEGTVIRIFFKKL